MIKRIFSFVLASLFIPTFVNSTDASVVKYNDVAPASTKVLFRMNLTSVASRINLSVPHSSSYRGQSTHVVVIDSGVEKAHPFLKDKVVLEACFAAKCPNGTNRMVGSGAAAPVHWHGTHVAGIIAGSNQQMTGIAPDVNIIAINVFDPNGAAYDDDIVAALNWVSTISSTYNISAVNMSLGTSSVFNNTCNGYIPEMTKAISDLKIKNIATVVSAGNGYSYGMSSPACITDTVSVAATYSSKDEVTNFSNISEHTDFSAPGYNVNSSSLLSSYRAASGTSMSAPVVSGAFAVYRSKFGIKSVDTVVDSFKSTSVSAKDLATNIFSKRIDMSLLFSDQYVPPVTTTTTTTSTTTTTTTVSPPVVSTTTTFPSSTTSTTLVDDDPDEDENVISQPLILSIRKHSSTFIRVEFAYSYTNVSIRNFALTCQSSSRILTTRFLPNRGYSYNLYYVRYSPPSPSRCKIAAVSTAGVYGPYTLNHRVR